MSIEDKNPQQCGVEHVELQFEWVDDVEHSELGEAVQSDGGGDNGEHEEEHHHQEITLRKDKEITQLQEDSHQGGPALKPHSKSMINKINNSIIYNHKTYDENPTLPKCHLPGAN